MLCCRCVALRSTCILDHTGHLADGKLHCARVYRVHFASSGLCGKLGFNPFKFLLNSGAPAAIGHQQTQVEGTGNATMEATS